MIARVVGRAGPPDGTAASNAGVFLARAESLLHEQDFTLAKVAAQSAEQIGIDAGIARPARSRRKRGRLWMCC